MQNRQVLSFEEDNHPLVEKRWPALWRRLQAAAGPREMVYVEGCPDFSLSIDGVLLSSLYGAEEEARLQAEQIPAGAPEAWVYGVGNGRLARRLLQRGALRRLRVVPLSLGGFRESLRYFDHRGWLADPRVELVDPRAVVELAGPFAVVPPCLVLAEEEAARLRDLLLMELNAASVAAYHRRLRLQYLQQIDANRARMAQDADVARLLAEAFPPSAIVAAAGPSLLRSMSWIKVNRGRNLLIAVDAALCRLLEAGLVPDVVVSVDANGDNVRRFFACDLSPCSQAPLVYFPVVDPEVLQKWPGRRYYAYSQAGHYDQVRTQFPGTSLFSSGSVTHVAIDLAVRTAASRVHLVGADFGFPGGELHANESAGAHLKAVTVQERDSWVRDGHGGRIATIGSYRAYLRDLETYIAAHPEVEFVNVGRDGAAICGTIYTD